jgi:ABC-type multidrug transport system permease subunit
MRKKITFLDKILSFRKSVVRQYIQNELSEYIKDINFKEDLVTRHWMFFFMRTIHIFIIISLLLMVLFFLIKTFPTISSEITK